MEVARDWRGFRRFIIDYRSMGSGRRFSLCDFSSWGTRPGRPPCVGSGPAFESAGKSIAIPGGPAREKENRPADGFIDLFIE